MRRFVLLVLAAALPLVACALDRPELDRLLARAAAAQGTNYLAARADLLAPGTNALPLLAAAAVDAGLDWRQRLVARICYERIVRSADIQTMRTDDWRNFPPYMTRDERAEWVTAQGTNLAAKWPPGARVGTVSGPSEDVAPFVALDLRERGLWYNYLEVNWKVTGEAPFAPPRGDREFIAAWPAYCRVAIEGEVEKSMLFYIYADRLEADPTFVDKNSCMRFYRRLMQNRIPDAVPVLVRRYEAYNKRKVIGPEMYPGEDAKIFAIEFAPILDFADERHVALLEAYIAEHPALAELKPKLAEVRARPAPAPVPEPPFRLGTMPVPAP